MGFGEKTLQNVVVSHLFSDWFEKNLKIMPLVNQLATKCNVDTRELDYFYFISLVQ